MKKIVIVIIAAVIILAAGIVLFLYLQPRFVWIVEDRFVEAWETVLTGSPFEGTQVIPQSAEEAALRRNWYGCRIGSFQEDGTNEGPVTVYRGLSGSERHEESLVLALDPWLLFRRFTTAPLSREQAENGPGGSGLIYMAGSDEASILAWTAQLLQESPGVFPDDEELWDQTGERLFDNGRFQPGAMTFTWGEILPYLLDEDANVWVYAPLSRIRGLPTFQTNSLEADIFPGQAGWNEFGFQAEILRAASYGNNNNRKKLGDAEEWVAGASLQGRLADTIGWLAAHAETPPFNPVSGNARIIWLTSSYVWEVKN